MSASHIAKSIDLADKITGMAEDHLRSLDKMLCFEVEVDTTNSMNDTFKTGGKYHRCSHGIVYVIAANVAEAAKLIPEATRLKLLGPAFTNGYCGEDK